LEFSASAEQLSISAFSFNLRRYIKCRDCAQQFIFPGYGITDIARHHPTHFDPSLLEFKGNL
jgi:hypothetical protein